jgi:hypothetical protein
MAEPVAVAADPGVVTEWGVVEPVVVSEAQAVLAVVAGMAVT